MDSSELAPPAVADNVLYVGSTSQSGSGTIYALDTSNGAEQWRFETREVMFGDYTRVGTNASPAVVDGLVYVATAPGDVYALKEVD
jgi:outer membrane protein assembly factor BamB